MPKSSNSSIASSHLNARAARREGKGIWVSNLQIKNLVEEDTDDPLIIVSSSHKIAAEMKAQLPEEHFHPDSFDFDLKDAFEFFTEASEEDENLPDDYQYNLSMLYNWADKNSVWIN